MHDDIVEAVKQYEVEAKYRLEENQIHTIFAQLYDFPVKTCSIVDYYYNTTGFSFRLRYIDGDPLVTMKKRVDAENGIVTREEYEESLTYEQEQFFKQFLQELGYRVDLVVPKIRTMWYLPEAEVAMDQLDGMSTRFLEIEASAPMIEHVAEYLGLSQSQIEHRSYPEIWRVFNGASAGIG